MFDCKDRHKHRETVLIRAIGVAKLICPPRVYLLDMALFVLIVSLARAD